MSLTWLNFHMLIRALFLLYFVSKCTCYDVAFMVVILVLLLWLYVGYKHGFMIDLSQGYFSIFTCN